MADRSRLHLFTPEPSVPSPQCIECDGTWLEGNHEMRGHDGQMVFSRGEPRIKRALRGLAVCGAIGALGFIFWLMMTSLVPSR